jgi:hypothetical protein
VAGLLAAAYLAPLVHFSLQGWLEAEGPTYSAFRYTEPVMSSLAEFTQTASFIFTAGFFIGAALLLWIDYALRRRTQEMGLILVSIGLGTFVVGIGIYLFPATSAFQSAIGTRSAPTQPGADEPLVWSRTPILGSTKDANGTIYAHTIGIVGKNIGAEDVQLDNIYIVSDITGTRIDLKVQIPNEGTIPAKETNPIPPDAFIQLSSDEFNPTAGVSEKDFLRDWGAISFVAEYGGQKHQTSFGHATIEALFDAQRPNFVPPQVSRKSPMMAAVGTVPAMEQAVQSASPISGDSLKRKRELLHAYAEAIDGPVTAAVQQGRAISDDWNALGGLTTQQFYVQLVVFNTDMTATFARIDDLRRRFQVEDATLDGLTNWTFDKILDKTAALTTELPPLFSLDDRSARETLLDNGSFVEWAAAIDDLERWIATTRKLVADKIKVYDSVADSGAPH